MRRTSRIRLVAVLCGLAALVLLAAVVASSSPGPDAARDGRPNLVVVMTDDQDVTSMRVMRRVERLLADAGTTFENAVTTTPLCCPSRATYLTGQYAHNHGVLSNQPENGSYYGLDQSETLPVWVDRAGYRTGHVGKYLNGYGSRDPEEVPPGWDEWHTSVTSTELGAAAHTMYGYTLNENGRLVDYGDAPADYQTDVLARKAVEFIDSSAGDPEPFFLTVSPLAPHTELEGRGPRPAPRHSGAFDGEDLPRPASFDEADVSDKPEQIRTLPRLDRSEARSIDRRKRARWESLLAIDDLVADVVGALERTGELERTLIVFTSDNGFYEGEHRIASDKRYVYEEAARVPLVIRGPGFRAGERRRALAGNVDLASTILDATGARPSGRPQDGRSLAAPGGEGEARGDRRLLIEYFEDFDEDFQVEPYRAIRTRDHVYVRHRGGEEELYDLRRDPHQLESRHADAAYAERKRRLARALRELEGCAGPTCR